ncbi:MAG: calcium-translocating P-type ATPase, PMCA-type [Ruminococcaceae bacterium]|nr:calcium-translocating P-type ATPase, PMCA-type [Oscillospiraceae bacterium]
MTKWSGFILNDKTYLSWQISLFYITNKQKGHKMKEYLKSSNEVLNELNTNENGLAIEETEKRLAENGKNKLAKGKKEPLIVRFLKQLSEPMTIILLVAAVISAAIELPHFPTDTVIILAVVLLNAILGVVQEGKAEKALEALQQISAATSKVIRNGHQITIKSEDIVVGDIVVLEAGDAVPCDCRIIESASLKAEEAALTGESVPSNKVSEALEPNANGDVPLGDRKNMVFMGSTIVYGRAKVVAVNTGMDTEMGKIADALSNAQEGKTPLQKKLSQLSKILTFIVIGICIVMFAINVIRGTVGGGFYWNQALESFMLAVALAVAAIPEGLATVVTMVLSIGVTNMSKRNAIIRKLTAVETLGCAQIICSDKTGTLTQNKMTVVDHFGDDEALLANAMSLCSDAEFDTEVGTAIGEPTECALVNYAEKLNLSKNDQKLKYVRINEVPFDSMRKMMTTIHNNGGEIIQFTKGAPDEILKRCTKVWENGGEIALSDEKRAEILSQNKNMADRALRVLAVGFKNLNSEPSEATSEALENELTFVGLVGMIDPVRPEVKAAINECKDAGIRAIMITGDHKDTAVAIALELGIISSADEAITGSELDKISDEDFETLVEKYSVYARVQPEHKTRIVNAWRKKGKVTAMTGDGVNDAPSIKNADIGVGMGITGTDVTKSVADMILTDDNFATIVSAVGEGRRIYDNIRKAIQFLLASNMSEVISVFLVSIISGATLFEAPHLLFINLITDCLPAIALGMEDGEKDIMKRKPRDTKEGVFARGLGFGVIYQGIAVAGLTLLSYFLGRYAFGDNNGSLGTSMAFLTLSMAEIFHSFNMRSLNGSIFTIKKQNLVLWGAGIIAAAATIVVLQVPIIAEKVFSLVPLNAGQFFAALGIGFAIIPIVEIVKLVANLIAKIKSKTK